MKNILRLKVFLSFTFLICLSSQAFSQEDAAVKEKKHYVNPQSIKVTKSGIFVLKNGKKLRVKSVSTDKNGTYITKNYCAKHDHWNFAGWPECGGCREESDAKSGSR